jgi:cytidine deaminase
MSDGRVFVGVHVEAHVGRITLCAEAVALGAALSAVLDLLPAKYRRDR